MRHLILVLSAALSAGVGILILWLSHAATTAGIIAGAGLVLLAVALAAPAQLAQAKAALVGLKDAVMSVQPPKQP